MTRPGDRPPGSRGIPRRPMTVEEEALEAGHELRDMRLRQVVRWLLLLTVGVTVLVVAVTVFERAMIGRIGPLVAVVEDPPRETPPPEPRLERTNGEALQVLRGQENQVLNNYTWVDEAAGTVSLPIERAIELTIERGLPVRPSEGGAGGEQQPPAVTLPAGSSSGRTLETIP